MCEGAKDGLSVEAVEFEVPVETSWALNIFQIRGSDGPSEIFHLTL